MKDLHKPSSIIHNPSSIIQKPSSIIQKPEASNHPSPSEGGLIRKSDLAMRYFPNATTPKLARDNLTRWINRCTPLAMAMAKTGYRTTDWYYTPRQVSLIYEYLGEP